VWSSCSVGEDAVADRCIVPDGGVLRPQARALAQVLEPARPAAESSTPAPRRSRASIFSPFRSGPDPVVSK
jgi:hypothetical protein